MKYKTIIPIIIIITIFSCHILLAEDQGGQSGGFLRLPFGSRPMGMGNTFVAISNDVNSMFYNPGGMYQIKTFLLGGSYTEMSFDRYQYNFNFIYPDTKYGNFGIMINSFGVQKIDNIDPYGNVLGTFDDSESAFSLTYCKSILNNLGLGFSAKYLHHSLQNYKATGIGFDIGLHSNYRLYNIMLGLGVAAKNLGASLKWDTDSEHEDKIPYTISSGIAADYMVWDNLLLTVAGEFDIIEKQESEFHFGFELWYEDEYSLRTGLANNNKLTFGGSIKYNFIQIDYAFAQETIDDSYTHKIGLTFNFSSKPPPLKSYRIIPKELTREKFHLRYQDQAQIDTTYILNNNDFLEYEEPFNPNEKLTYMNSDFTIYRNVNINNSAKYLEIQDAMNLVIIDLNHTSTDVNKKQTKEFVDFINSIILESNTKNILLYKYLNIFPQSLQVFDYYNIEKVNIADNPSFQELPYNYFSRENCKQLLDYINKFNIEIDYSNLINDFFVFDELTDGLTYVNYTDARENINNSQYKNSVINHIMNLRKNIKYEMKNIYYITYYPSENNIFENDIKFLSFKNDKENIKLLLEE